MRINQIVMLLASTVLLLASCSKDKGDKLDEANNLSEVVTWADFDVTDIEVTGIDYDKEENYSLAKIESPKSPCTVKFPDPPSERLTDWNDDNDVELAISDKSAKYAVGLLLANKRGLVLTKFIGLTSIGTLYIFANRDVTITGSSVEEIDDENVTVTIDLKLKRGWNSIYFTSSLITPTKQTMTTTTPTGVVRWLFVPNTGELPGVFKGTDMAKLSNTLKRIIEVKSR